MIEKKKVLVKNLSLSEMSEEEYNELNPPVKERYEYLLLLEFLEKDGSEKAQKLLEKVKTFKICNDYNTWEMENRFKLFLQSS